MLLLTDIYCSDAFRILYKGGSRTAVEELRGGGGGGGKPGFIQDSNLIWRA